MRERVRDEERLKHILEAIEGIQESQEIYSYEDLERSSIIFYGFVKYLEIIGEAVYMLTKEFRNEHPEVEWDAIEKMRHVLVHGYYHIMPTQLWKTIEEDLPVLKVQIEKLLFPKSLLLGDISAQYGCVPLPSDWSDMSLLDVIRYLSPNGLYDKL